MTANPQPGLTTLTFHRDGFERDCLVYTPPRACETLQFGQRPPLVLIFHGGGGTAEITLVAEHWITTADRAGFIAAAPNGLRTDPTRKATFLRNPQFWNVAAPFTDQQRRRADDVALADQIIDTLLDTHGVDPARVYAAGFSNGAAMTYRLGVLRAERLAAIATVAGHLWQDTKPAAPLSLLTIAGDTDPLAPLEGGSLKSPWGHDFEPPPLLESATRWAAWHDCAHSVRTERDDDQLRVLQFGPCAGGAEVRFVLIKGGGHVWPGGGKVLHENIVGRDTGALNATDYIWRFFEDKRAQP